MGRRRRIRETKRKHEAQKRQHKLLSSIYEYSNAIVHVDAATSVMDDDGTARFFLPAVNQFRHSTPHSPPMGIVFVDGSFLTVKEIFRYDYATDNATDPSIVRSEFSYHYQIPHRGFFFRYDYHPDVGDLSTHPPYHLHVGCWHGSEEKLPSLPRFRVPAVMLEEVLDLIVRDFLLVEDAD